MNVFCVYAPQVGLPEETKDLFYNNLLNNISKVPSDEFLLICGDLNGHVGKLSTGFDNIHGGHGFGNLNREGTRILDLCAAANLAVANTYFEKPVSQLITYQSGNITTQVDYILIRRCELKQMRNVKVIGSEECITKRKFLVCDINLKTLLPRPYKAPVRRRIWKLRKADV